ncbi:protein FAR1-RELATED SEQUENCE 2-like [Lycium barbarum]|uniref:protein FAR1-RELATED SEQUENCE 2-like n=2 Tax=Lycium barbarum TaxID=112863 RepID=UPI00293E7173|nr:protein FAR1-RELATED SEQUENCE 2-like [Lycium barbarum]XP_060217334.1 protein FAR1-RELATED SEQUENCE 2-like [Lycium barbarum]XP_060217336.1 protein FAR1-RELATED SEQUENCE 2-like [Lycium barbarum]
MEIHNDMSVRVYVELKKENKQLAMYPLCITTTDKSVDTCVSGESCIEGGFLQIGYIKQTNAMETVVSGDLASSSCGNAVVVFENDTNLVISDKNQKEVVVDQVYKDKDTLKVVMANYAISNRFNFRAERSNAIRASSVGKSEMFRVREFRDKHTCPLKDKVYSQRHATSWLIGGIVKPKVANYKRKYTPNDIAEDVRNDLGMDVSYMVAWRAKEKSMKDLMGEPSDSYKKLPGYLYILDKTYPGSHIRMRKFDENEFLYLLIALYAFIKGFDCCRPIVVVDGSHLKTAYNGTFVSASTLDGAGNILPLAYGVIDSENDRSWTWFFERFREAYGVRENMCIVSDRHESINKAVSKIYPNVPHYACIWHLWGNVCKKYKKSHDVLSPVFYAMAKAYTQEDFDELMGKVEKADFRVAEYLELAGREKWARVYATANRGWTMTSNIAECINRHLVAARELPIFDFLEEVKKMFGRWNYNNRKNGTYTFTTLGKKFQEMLSINEYLCLRMTAEPSTEYLYTVYDAGRHFIVNLDNKTCSCRMFQIDEIPCPHAWAAIKKKNLIADDYCSGLFKPHTVVKTYDVAVDPLPDEREWKIPTYISEDVVLPPRYKRPPGRPKKKRDKPLFELLLGKKRHACSTCGQTGHNRRSCSNAPRRK